MTLNLRDLDPRMLDPLVGARDDHFVELYDDDASLIDSVRTFVAVGVSEGDAAIVVATPSHREAIEWELRRSIDLEAARDQGVFQSLDAEETLALFMDGDAPDPARFERVLGDIIELASRGGTRKVRVFGEMVAVLWAQENVTAALALEDLWNRLAKSHRFRLFCGYPSHAFEEGDLTPLGSVCNRHTHVIVAAS